MLVADVYKKELEDYELLMSCMTVDYTRKTKTGQRGYINLDYDQGPLCFEIDWSGACVTYVRELKNLDPSIEIVGWDSDDICYVSFEDIVIDNRNKRVILT